MHVYEQLYELDGMTSSLSPAELDEWLATSPDAEVIQTIRYRSVHLAVTFRDTTPGVPDLPRLTFDIEGLEFDHSSLSRDETRRRIDDLADFLVRCYGRSCAVGHPPQYIFGASPTHVAKLRQDSGFLRTTIEGVRAGELEELYWLQLLPPQMAERVGRNRLASAPAPRVDKLDDGAVLLMSHEDPLQFASGYLDVLESVSLDR